MIQLTSGAINLTAEVNDAAQILKGPNSRHAFPIQPESFGVYRTLIWPVVGAQHVAIGQLDT